MIRKKNNFHSGTLDRLDIKDVIVNPCIQDNWLSVVMLCSYTQYVFESFRMQQINIFFFSLKLAWLRQSIVDCIVFDCIVVVLYLLFVDLRGFDGTKVNCFDDAVEAQHVAAGVDQHEHSLYKHEHSFDQHEHSFDHHDHAQDPKEHSLEPARAYTGKWALSS